MLARIGNAVYPGSDNASSHHETLDTLYGIRDRVDVTAKHQNLYPCEARTWIRNGHGLRYTIVSSGTLLYLVHDIRTRQM